MLIRSMPKNETESIHIYDGDKFIAQIFFTRSEARGKRMHLNMRDQDVRVIPMKRKKHSKDYREDVPVLLSKD